MYKQDSLWLEHNYDDVNHDVIDNSPKFALVFAIDWYLNTPRIIRKLKLEKIKEKYES